MNWIKLRDDLKDDPAVLQMAILLKMDVWGVIGRLADVWAWVGRHTATGENVRVDDAMIDVRVRKTGFAAAMRKARWLAGRKGALCFPHWERHNANCLKARLLDTEERKGRGRGRKKGKTVASGKVTVTASDRMTSADRRGRTSKSARRRTKKKTEKKIRGEKISMHTSSAATQSSDAAAQCSDAAAQCTEAAARRLTPHECDGEAGVFAVQRDGSASADVGANTGMSAMPGGGGQGVSVWDSSREEVAAATSVRARGRLPEMIAFCRSLGLETQDAEYCFHKWEGSGWKNSGRKIACWRSTIRAWMSAGYLPVRRQGQDGARTARGTGNPGSGHRRGEKVPSRTYEMTGRGPVSWDPMSGDGPPAMTSTMSRMAMPSSVAA